MDGKIGGGWHNWLFNYAAIGSETSSRRAKGKVRNCNGGETTCRNNPNVESRGGKLLSSYRNGYGICDFG